MKNTLQTHVLNLLTRNEIYIDKKELYFQIQSHPSYPSLHAVTGVLDHFNIDNIALMVPVDKETVLQLPSSFLAQIKTDEGEEFMLVSKKEETFELIGETKVLKNISVLKFIELFTGVVVAVEKDITLDTNLSTKKTNFKLPLIIATACCFLVSLFFIDIKIGETLFLLASLIGVYINYSIKKQEVGESSFLGNAFCSGEASKTTSCNDVLTSTGATVYKNLKISDLSLIYFTGITIATYVLITLGENLSIEYWISLSAIPITVYSIYYQAFVVKKWCLLCLGIVGTLWLQTSIMIGFISLNTPSLESALILISSFILVGTIWAIISPILSNQKELKDIKIQHFKFKRNFNLFNTLLQSTNSVDTNLVGSPTELIFGNTNASLKIVVVTSPFCGHCKEVHTLAENILKRYSDSVAISIRFNIFDMNEKDRLLQVATRLFDIYTTKGQVEALEAMHDIYEDNTTANWFKKWGKSTSVFTYEETFRKKNEWCAKNKINFTPEILIGGKSYPKEYDRSDLIYFVEELIENSLTVTTSQAVLETA